MPAAIDQSLIPQVIRDSVDPEILARAQSIEWSIARDIGEDEHGYLDGNGEEYRFTSESSARELRDSQSRKSRKIEWLDTMEGRDSGFERTPTTPSLNNLSSVRQDSRNYSSQSISNSQHEQQVDFSSLDDSLYYRDGGYAPISGSMKSLAQNRNAQGQPAGPFPIYRVNQDQLLGEVSYEVAPRARPGERTVHYEKSSRIFNEEELNAMGIDPSIMGPNSKATVDECEEEIVETSVIKSKRELDELCNAMTTDASPYFERQRARSASPLGSKSGQEVDKTHRTVVFESMEEISNRDQEYFPYRDAHQGKPLPGDNEYGTWGSRFDDKRQWKLCNGQWVRVAEPKPQPKPEKEHILAERVKCKPMVARTEPVRQLESQSGSTDSDSDGPMDDNDDASSDLDLGRPIDQRSASRSPPLDGGRRSPVDDSLLDLGPSRRRPLLEEKPLDIEALKDKYRPKPDAKKDKNDDTNTKPTGTILLKPPPAPVEEIKVQPVTPIYVEMRKPLKEPDGEEEKLMEDPNLMWMQLGPAQYGPPFGTLKGRKAREEEWIGPPCELCHKQIEERRCMLAENMKFHCWHYVCSFCMKTLKPADFLIAEYDSKPYCLNCHKREFPEISLTQLKLEA